MGNKANKKENNKNTTHLIESIQAYHTANQNENSKAESNGNDYMSDNASKIKQYLKLVYKSNFVSLTYVNIPLNYKGRPECLFHSIHLEEIHHT